MDRPSLSYGAAGALKRERGQGSSRGKEAPLEIRNPQYTIRNTQVDELRSAIRPEIATMGTNALAQFDREVVDLKQRIAKRVAHLRRHLFAPAPALTSLSVGGEAQVTDWLWSIEHGKAVCGEPLKRGSVEALKRDPPASDFGANAGRDAQSAIRNPQSSILRMRLEPGSGDEAVATWEARVLLPKGAYRFSTTVSCDQKIFRGAEWPVALKIWGGADQQFEGERKDPQHVALAESFTITSEASEEILIQCQARSREINLTFQFDSLILSRTD